MSNLLIKNSASTSITSGLTAVVTSISVVDGSVFPSIGVDQYFYATLEEIGDFENTEIVKVTARSGNTLTVERGAESTPARTFTAGATIEQRITAQTILDLVPSVLDDFVDLDVGGAANGEILVFNSTSGKWENSPDAPNALTFDGNAPSYFFSEGHLPEMAEVNGLVAALAGKLGVSGTAADSNQLGGVPAANFFSTLHKPEVSEVTGLQAALDGKLATTGTAADSALLGGQNINYFFTEGHEPEMSEVVGLVAALAGKSATGHGHAIADITGLTAALAQGGVTLINDAPTRTIVYETDLTYVTRHSAGAATYTLDSSTFSEGNKVFFSRLKDLVGTLTITADEGTITLPDNTSAATQTLDVVGTICLEKISGNNWIARVG